MKPEEMVWNAPKAPAPRSTPGELLCEFLVGHVRYRVELRDHGHEQGIEAQFLKNEEFSHSRRFAPWMGLTVTPREHAVRWITSEEEAAWSARQSTI